MTYKFSCSELVDILLVYGECGQNCTAARRRYAELYPNRYLPSNRIFTSVFQRARDTGNLEPLYRERGCERTNHVLEAEGAILEAVEKNPTLSTRQIARDLHVSHYVVWRTLKEMQGLRSNYFNCEKVLALETGDFAARVGFCQWLSNKYNHRENFISEVLFTDEACFTNYGIVNIHSENERPKENDEHLFSVNVWAGIVNKTVIGPFLLPDSVTEQSYLEFLQNDLQPLLEDIPIDVRLRMWFQHEGATAYFTPKVREHLNQEFEDRWMGRGGPIAWPPRSSDLHPIEFFLWGYLKQIVYETEISDVEELKNRIHLAANMIKEQGVLEQRHESLMQRAFKCLQTDGAAFQHLL